MKVKILHENIFSENVAQIKKGSIFAPPKRNGPFV